MDKLERIVYKGYQINTVTTIAGTSYSFNPASNSNNITFASSIWKAKVEINKLINNLKGETNATNN
jgi:hypothetical protein